MLEHHEWESHKELVDEKKPDCYKCVHRRAILGDCHSRCNNVKAKVEGDKTGIKNGWFMWPLNFDPTWLISCNGFSDKKEDDLPEQKIDPLSQLRSLLK